MAYLIYEGVVSLLYLLITLPLGSYLRKLNYF